MVVNLFPHEVEKHFDKKLLDYWKPYLSKLKEDEWYLYKFIEELGGNYWNLKSPFINTCFDNESLNKDKKVGGVHSGLYKRKVFWDGVNKDNVEPHSSIFSFVEKWKRCSYFYKVLIEEQKFNHSSDDDIWKLISEIWTGVEYPYQTSQSRYEWNEILQFRNRPETMKKRFPDNSNFVVYRGGHPEGLSWTPDKNVGVWFYRRNSMTNDPELNILSKKTVKGSDILFVGGREEEYVLHPRTTLYDYQEVKVSKKDLENCYSD